MLKTCQQIFSMFCIFLMLVPAGHAQVPVPGTQPPELPQVEEGVGPWYRVTAPYRGREVRPINLANSGRLDQLVRAGIIYLSLQDAIAAAIENNIDIEVQRYGPLLAELDLRRARAGGLIRGVTSNIFGGQQNFGATAGGAGTGAVQTNQSLNQFLGTQIPSLDPVLTSTVSWAHRSQPQSNTIATGVSALVTEIGQANFGVQQGFLTGTSVSLNFNNPFIDQNAFRNDLNPTRSPFLQVQMTQRLLQGFGLAVNRRNIRIAGNNVRVADLNLRNQIITTVADVTRLYWDLVSFNEEVGVRRQALALAQRLYEDNKKQVEIGTLAPIEIVRAEAEVAAREQELTTAETNVLQQETLLKNSISRTGNFSPQVADARIVPTDRIRIPATEPVEPIQDLVGRALENRPELQQSRLNIDNARINLTGLKNALLPSIDAFVDLRNNSLAGQINTQTGPPGSPLLPRNPDQFFVGSYTSALGQIFRRNFPDYAFGAQLNIPLRNRAAQADFANAQLTVRQNELQFQRQSNGIRVEVQNSLIALQQARARHRAAEKSRQLAEQTLDAEQKKYQLGASSIFFVIQAQRDVANAQFAEVQALTAYARARVQLEVATGTVLERNNISIEEAKAGRISFAPTPIPNNR